jgi:hypothetical protein
MLHKIETPTIEKTRPTLKQRARKAGALITATAALSGLTAPVASAEHSPGKPSRTEAVSTQLRNPQELPGLKIHLGRETLNKLKASTVEIASRLKVDFGGSSDGGWSPSCTAVKVSIPGQKDPFIMTAAHCFGSITGVGSGAFTDSLNPSNKAENFTKVSPYEYAVLDPDADFYNRLALPVAIIDRISIGTDNKDVALLHAAAMATSPKAPYHSVRKFADIPAIPLKVAEKVPIQGTPVALYGEPGANNFEPIIGTGVYLGRVSYSVAPLPSGSNAPDVYRQLDLVGINPPGPQEDNCNYGTSGSMALLPNGTLLGNLSFRTSHGYGLNREVQLPDSIDFDNYQRPIWEEELNVKLDDFEVICGYTVMDSNTPSDLIEGYKHPAPISTYK